MDFKLTKLGNGAQIVSSPMKERESVSMGLWVRAGSRDESLKISGISHFLEHLVFKGTASRSANQIKEQVEGVGGSLNAFTSEESTCFLAKVSRRHFESVFAVLSDMVLNATLQSADIEKERNVILEEIKMTQDHPSQLVEELLCETLWGGHALGRPIAGTQETVKGITRQEIVDYRDRFYGSGYLTIAAAGAIDHKTLTKVSQRYFGDNKLKKEKRSDDFKSTQSERFKFFDKKTEQTHLSLATPAFQRNHPDEAALDLLSIILGGNMSSRLFNEVREERGLAYEIGSSERKFHETGAFVVSAGVDHQKAVEALEVISKELHKTTRELVTEDELTRAREFYLGQFQMGLENTMNRMIWVGENAVCFGKVRDDKEIIRKVQKVSREDLREVAKRLFKPGAYRLSLVGPDAGKAAGPLRKLFS